MIKKIPAAIKRRMDEERIRSLRIANAYERRLINLRTNEIKRVLKDLENVPVKNWANYAPDMLTEDYLPKFYESLYLNVGLPVAKEAINNFIGRKSDDMWEESIRGWLSKNAGRKITLVNGTLKEWVSKNINEVLSDTTAQIEGLNRELYKRVLNEWVEVREWQTRRIVQTEAMTASSVAGFESVRSLGVPFTKTWSISGNNTRPGHLEMEGETVDSEEPFMVDGELMMYPRDDSMGASAANIINCACTHIALPKSVI